MHFYESHVLFFNDLIQLICSFINRTLWFLPGSNFLIRVFSHFLGIECKKCKTRKINKILTINNFKKYKPVIPFQKLLNTHSPLVTILSQNHFETVPDFVNFVPK